MSRKNRKTTRRASTAVRKPPKTPASAQPPTQDASRPKVSIFDEWAALVAGTLTAESTLVKKFISHPGILGSAREALIANVLSRILPAIYEIGTGQVVDVYGKKSKQMDIVIARRDFPCMRFPDGSAQYLIESVLATIEVKSQMTRETLAEALDNTFSLGELRMSFEPESLQKMVDSCGLTLLPSGDVMKRRPDGVLEKPLAPILEAVTVPGRPESYIISFSGYAENLDDFKEALKDWLRGRTAGLRLSNLPTVIAAQGCLALRNQYGAAINVQERTWGLMFARREPNPLGYLVRQLLQHLQKSVPVVPTADGLRPSITPYLGMDAPQTADVVGWASLDLAPRSTTP